ncbi:MAG: hypothetical protein AB7I25_07225 [Vicinamibacterales bacterium]
MSDALSVYSALAAEPTIWKFTLAYIVGRLVRVLAFGRLKLFWELLAHNHRRRAKFEASI